MLGNTSGGTLHIPCLTSDLTLLIYKKKTMQLSHPNGCISLASELNNDEGERNVLDLKGLEEGPSLLHPSIPIFPTTKLEPGDRVVYPQ